MRFGNKNAQRYNTLEDVLSNTNKTPKGCMEWNGPTDKHGYAHCNASGIFMGQSLHREVMRMAQGIIPPVVMHKCDNRKCINPEHLSAGTSLLNVQDMDSKKRRAVGGKNGNAKFSDVQIKNMLTKLSQAGYKITCSEFGVSRGYLWKLKAGQYRRDNANS